MKSYLLLSTLEKTSLSQLDKLSDEDLENTGSAETEMFIPTKRARTEQKEIPTVFAIIGLAIIHLEASPISLWT